MHRKAEEEADSSATGDDDKPASRRLSAAKTKKTLATRH